LALKAVNSSSLRRAEILAVAADLFARHGFERTTVREIGEAAGILSGSLYHHFKSKDAILEEIFNAYFDELEERWNEILETIDAPALQFESMLRELVLAVDRHPGAARTLTQEWSNLLHLAQLQARWKRLEADWLKIIDAGVEAGEFRSDVDRFFLYSIGMDAVRGVAGWYRPKSRSRIDDLADAYISVLMKGISA
jgi:TetR/AcrR family transcriptional regulator, cholesterol catabolism regulator